MFLQPLAVAGPRHEPFNALFQHGFVHENVGALGEIGQRRKEGRIGGKDHAFCIILEAQGKAVGHRRMVDTLRPDFQAALFKHLPFAEFAD